MADTSDDAVFWLPQFLTEDDLLVDQTNEMINKPKSSWNRLGSATHEGSKLSVPFQTAPKLRSFGLSSDLSSPVESESDEEDSLSGTTLKMARVSLEDELRRRPFAREKARGWGLSGSPQSTLCSVGRGCGCRQSSPNCQSKVSSPPATLDLLYAAAEEVARMRMSEEAYRLSNSRGFLPARAKPDPIPNHDVTGLCTRKKLHALELIGQVMEQQSAWGPQRQREALRSRGRNGQTEFVPSKSNGPAGSGRPLNLSPSAWPPIEQTQNGSGMRAILLGSHVARKRESSGTGVFLPRTSRAPTETRKKSGCSTALLPDRVVHALNKSLDVSGGRPQFQSHPNGGFNSARDGGPARLVKSGDVLAAMKQNLRMNHGVRLPQDWTY